MQKTEPYTIPEVWRVILWRQDLLEKAGYPVLAAMQIAERGDIDLHRACDLLARGATLNEALRILL